MSPLRLASGMVDALRSQPLALALVLVNVIYLIGFGWVMGDIAKRVAERDTSYLAMMQECVRGRAEEK